MKNKTDRSKARLFFMRGLASLLPTILTIVVLFICYRFVRDNVAAPINHTIHRILVNTSFGRDLLERYGGVELDLSTYRYRVRPYTEWMSFKKPDSNLPDRQKLTEILNDAIPPILGFLIALLLIFVIGFILASYLGRRVFVRFENLLSKFPVIKIIYPNAKQLVEFFFKEKKLDFNTVVAFEYPRREIWAIGFMTGDGLRQLHEHCGRPLVSVFIPSSPAPMTGYTVFVPRSDVIPLDIDVEQAFRLIITGGVIVPASQVVSVPAAHDVEVLPVASDRPLPLESSKRKHESDAKPQDKASKREKSQTGGKTSQSGGKTSKRSPSKPGGKASKSSTPKRKRPS